MNKDFLHYSLCALALALCVLVLISELPEQPKDSDIQSVTAYCDSYNPSTGWFTLIDENGFSKTMATMPSTANLQ